MRAFIAIVLSLVIFGGTDTPIQAQGKPKPTLAEMEKSLLVSASDLATCQLRVKQLEYHDLRDRRDGLIAQTRGAETDYSDTLKKRDRLQQMIQRLSKAVATKEVKEPEVVESGLDEEDD